MKKYYQLVQTDREADVYIFGDITSWEWFESDVSSYTLSRELQGLDVDVINVHLNSYGGEVGEGLAIYNMLKNHSARVRTVVDGFACSIASVIFMAGEERIMNDASLLMVHNAWMRTAGNSGQLRKDADDLDVITQASVAAYMSAVSIDEDELKALLDAETWLSPAAALEKGFATSVVGVVAAEGKAAASARKSLFALVHGGGPAEQTQTVDIDELANKIISKLKAEDPPKENKTIKFLSALMGGKE